MNVGRIRATESLFYYDIANGLNYDYYNNISSYSPQFDIQPTAEQEEVARRICTVNNVMRQSCVYDYYATGNEIACSSTAKEDAQFTIRRNELGSSVILSYFVTFVSRLLVLILSVCHHYRPHHRFSHLTLISFMVESFEMISYTLAGPKTTSISITVN